MCKVGYSTTQFTFILLPPNVLTNYVIYAILLLARYTNQWDSRGKESGDLSSFSLPLEKRGDGDSDRNGASSEKHLGGSPK